MATFNPIRGVAAALNYDTADDVKFYSKATKGLDDVHKYDLSPGKLKAFLDQIRKRARQFGWANVLSVPTIVVAPAVAINRNILDAYGTVTLAECTAHATVYMTALPVTRDGQNASMLYHFLYDSLTPEGLLNVNIDPSIFTINGEVDGLCLLRTIITKAQLDTVGTVNTLQSSLGKLDVKIVELAANIETFHMHVNTITNVLDSYGEPYPELILNLFKSYMLIEDVEFKTFVLYLEFGYTVEPANFNARNLMGNVENAYKRRVEAGT
jgi:hypothetical protein